MKGVMDSYQEGMTCDLFSGGGGVHEGGRDTGGRETVFVEAKVWRFRRAWLIQEIAKS